MAHTETQLISRIIYTGCLPAVIEWGITEEDFRTSEAHSSFCMLKAYYTSADTSGSVPGENAVLRLFPGMVRCDDLSMTTDALCCEVRKNRITVVGKEAILKASQAIDFEPMSAVADLNVKTHTLLSLGLKTIDQQFPSGMDETVLRYERMENGLGWSTLTWPWGRLNECTAGLQDDDYIVLYGRPKSMKSFVLSAMAAHIYDEDKHILIYTKEMPAWQLFRRIAGFICRFEYDTFRLGRLAPHEKRRLLDLRESIKQRADETCGAHNITVLSGRDAPAGTDSMSWLRGKVDKYKPDVVFIDGLYLMSADSKTQKDNERVMKISRAARQMVLDTKIPLVATMQANRAAAKHQNAEFDEIAYSDAIGQDATVAIRVINEKETPTIALVLAGSREFKLHGIRIWARPCEDFSYKEEMTEKDIRKAKEGDAKEEEAEDKKPIGKGKGKPKTASDKAVEDALNKQMRKVSG